MSIEVPKVGELLSMVKDNDWLSLLFALLVLVLLAFGISSLVFRWGSSVSFFGIASIISLAFIPIRTLRINGQKKKIKNHEEKIYSKFCQIINDLKRQTNTQIQIKPEDFKEIFPLEGIEKLREYLEKAYSEGLIRKKQGLFYICNY